MKRKKSIRVIVVILSFPFILMAMLLVMMPVISLSIIDYSSPRVLEWEIQEKKTDKGEKKEEKQIKVKWESMPEAMIRFQKAINFPFCLNITESIVYGLFLWMIFFFLMGFIYDLKDDDDCFSVVAFMLLTFGILVAILIYAPLAGFDEYNVFANLKNNITDKALVKELISYIWIDAIAGRMLIPGIVLFVLMVFSSYIYSLISKTGNGLVVKCIKNPFNKWKNKVSKKLMKDLFAGSSRVIQILPNEQVELADYHLNLKWLPMPRVVLSKEVVKFVSMDSFFSCLTHGVKEVVCQDLREKILEKYNQYQIKEKCVIDFVNKFISKTKQEFNVLAAKKKKSQLQVNKEKVDEIIEQGITKTLLIFKNEVAKIGKKEIDAILFDFKNGLTQEIVNKVSSFSVENRSCASVGGGVLPQGARFFLQNDKLSVVAVEQAPQTRNISVDPNFSGYRNKEFFTLAFPYVVFLIFFNQDRFSNLWMFYRNKSLRSIDDMLYIPNLSNIYSGDCRVCLRFPGHNCYGIVERTNEIISYFWNSVFNDDLKSNYCNYQKKDERIRNFSHWEKFSQKNPFFPLSIEWDSVCSLRQQVLNILFSDSDFNQDFGERIHQEIDQAFNSGEDDFQASLKKSFSQIKVNGEYSAIGKDLISKYERELIEDLFDILCAAFAKISKDENLSKAFLQILEQSIRNVLEEEFNVLAKEISLKRGVNVSQLIEAIREGD